MLPLNSLYVVSLQANDKKPTAVIWGGGGCFSQSSGIYFVDV